MSNRTENPRIASDRISKLDDNEIFVFGSNLQGMHGGGAARVAYDRFGAVWGVGVGLTGRAYAIPTMQGDVDTIKPYVDQFIDFAKNSPGLKFLVTRIGCGIAGFTDEEMAPLFADALNLENVYLPKAFYDELTSKPQVPVYIQKKIHGQTRTLVDILIGLNEQEQFRSSEEAIDAVMGFLKNLRDHGDEIAFNCSVRSLWSYARNSFVDGNLDAEKLKLSLEKNFYDDNVAAKAYMNYVVEKSMGLIMYMNEFRRYTNAEQIINDFQKVTGGVNHCGPQNDFYFFDFGGYPIHFFRNYVHGFWTEFAPNGELDNKLFYDFMIGRHERGIKKYGLDAVVKRNYKADGPCHPEVFFPYRGGAAPVYVELEKGMDSCVTVQKRRLIKSCGEGKGPNRISDCFEFRLVKDLIQEDPKFTILEDYRGHTFLVPKDDVTLPVYDYYQGKMDFDSSESKEAAIRRFWEIMKR